MMIGMGTLANTGAIVLGGLIGLIGGRRLSERYQKTIVAGMAMCVMFVGIAGTLKEMLQNYTGTVPDDYTGPYALRSSWISGKRG